MFLAKIYFDLEASPFVSNRFEEQGLITRAIGYDLIFKYDLACVYVCVYSLIDRNGRENDTRFVILGADNGPVGNERAIVSIARKHEFRGAREYTGAII